MKYVNLTPHPVNVYGEMVAPVYSLKPCANPARVVYKEINLGKLTKRKIVIGAENLPPPKAGTIYVVSNPCRVSFPARTDLASPCTSVEKDGKVVGCKWLVLN